MKKKSLFLAASVAAVSAGALVNGSAFAAQQTIILETEDAIKIAQAIDGHSNITNVSYTDSAPYPHIGEPALIVGDGEMPTALTFDCSDGDPLAGVTDYSLLTHTLFSDIESIKLCSADSVDWESLSQMPGLYSLSISPIDNPGDMSPEEYVELRDEVAGQPIVDITGIEKMTNLEYLTIVGIPLGNLQTIPQLSNINSTFLYSDAITDVSGLMDMPNLGQQAYFRYLYRYNNIEDISPLMDYCMEYRNCDKEDWKELAEDDYVFFNMIRGNRTIIETKSETEDIPAHILGIIEAYFESDDYDTYVKTEGLSYTFGESKVKLDTSASTHVLKINGTDDDEIISVEYKYSKPEEKNPDTGDHSIMGWAFGIAAAIFAGAGVAIRSRR